jgi:hypothetical protein
MPSIRLNLTPLETHEQIAFVQWCLMAGAPYSMIFAIPNGGKRHITTAARLRREGVRPGVPDLFLPFAAGGAHGLFVELKRINGGAATKHQKSWEDVLQKNGYAHVYAMGCEDAIKKIKLYVNGGAK